MFLLSKLINNKSKNNRFKPDQNENGFSINIGIDIKKLLEDGILKKIYDTIFQENKIYNGLTRIRLEKSLVNNQTFYYFAEDGNVFYQMHFDIFGENVFFNDSPIPYGKIVGYFGIPYDKDKIQNDDVEFISEGIKVRAFVVNGLLRIQIGKYCRNSRIKIGDKFKSEVRFDIAILSLENLFQKYPLNKKQYNSSQKILLEDIEDGIYGDFYDKSNINNSLSNIEEKKYFGQTVGNTADYVYIKNKVDVIKNENPTNYLKLKRGEIFDYYQWANNKYTNIELRDYRGTESGDGLSRYLVN